MGFWRPVQEADFAGFFDFRAIPFYIGIVMTIETVIVSAEFPELKRLVWNRDVTRPISAEEVFTLYERNWRFVDTAHLTDREAELIRDLTRQFGHDVLLV